MSRLRVRRAFVVAVAGLVVASIVPGSGSVPAVADEGPSPIAVLRGTANDIGWGDPDLPPVGPPMDRVTYLRLRAGQIAMYRGAPFDLDYNARLAAVQVLDRELARRGKTGPAWTPIGPAPIPNGQVAGGGSSVPVSGRVTAIVVDPTDANVVYAGTAQGGVYRSKNGGTNWTPLMDGAASLAIGALALAPSDHTILYVGTGEGNLSADSYAGVGIYRIDSANGTTPVVNGPFETRVAGTGTTVDNGHAFLGAGIQGIAVDPADAARIYVASTLAGIGVSNDLICCGLSANGADVGLYRSTNATAASPTFSLVAGGIPANGVSGATDVLFLPGSSSTLLAGSEDLTFSTVSNNGVWRTTTANQASPTFTHISLPNGSFNLRLAASGTTVLAGIEANLSGLPGRVFKSTDGGVTFPTTLTDVSGFCGGQCFYDIALGVNPSDATKMLVGGSADDLSPPVPSQMLRSTNGTSFSVSDTKLHADSHAVAYAASSPATVYTGNDGGIYRSTDGGATWTSLNNAQFSATQFESVAVHPTDPNFTIGGTQDNGTPMRNAAGTWTRADFGDGGFAAIDQNAADTSTVRMYHTYFNAQNSLVGYVTVGSVANASDGNWVFRGCDEGFTENDIQCSENPLFYAPLELGPGNPNTVYYGTDRLHRSSNLGVTNPVVSQTFPIATAGQGRISAIGISPKDDHVRMIGGALGGVFGTSTAANPLLNLDPSNTIPNKYVSRVVVDPNTKTTAYVTINGFLGGIGAAQSHVWKTTNLSANPPTWTAKNSGLPDVPVNAFVVDPINSAHLYAGTDVGVYASTDGGSSWAPFGTGLPVVAIFDMAVVRPGTSNEILRVATHGKGMWDAVIGTGGTDTIDPTAKMTQPSKTVTISKSITLAWTASDTGGSGLDDVDIRVKSANFNSGFGSFTQPAGLQHLTGTSKVFTGAAGKSYCFSVRARDNAGNLSAFSASKCTMIPVDDKTMTVGAGTWTRKTGQSGAFLGTLSVASAKNSSLTLSSLHAKQVGILAKRCSTCGKFTITFGGQTVIADTSGSGFVVFTMPTFSTVKISNLVVKVSSSGKPVQIDGVAAPQTGAITFGPTAIPARAAG